MSSEKSPTGSQAGRAKRTTEKAKREFSSVSLPAPLVEKIEEVVNELGYWPTKTAFVREAAVEKLDGHTHKREKEGRPKD